MTKVGFKSAFTPESIKESHQKGTNPQFTIKGGGNPDTIFVTGGRETGHPKPEKITAPEPMISDSKARKIMAGEEVEVVV